MNPVASEVKQHIAHLVSNGITNTGEVRRSIRMMVETTISPPPNENNRAYYPLDTDIRNHVQIALRKYRLIFINTLI